MSAVNDNKPRRRYTSATRSEGALRTRQAIVATASALFAEHGYAATSLAGIATAAGVARPTVFAAFGSKGALLRQVLDEALAGDDAPVPVAERPWFRPVWDAATPAAVLDAYAGVCLLIARRAAPLFEAVRRAADDAPEAAELWQTLLDNRRAGARMVVAHARGLGPLAPGLDEQSAVDVLWVYNDPGLFAALVSQRGWAEPAFRDWLAAAMRAALLPDRGLADRPAAG
ncbi:TetR/AcrR family transcriptional regulator [Dactylosporangium sp. CA-052675]|uniref:TetR/AcrR family transcriptional regulator n=1 Tax=Dactylosporangium sp. CA-052675 TaxID=3239927 RepID=UPI003D8D9194